MRRSFWVCLLLTNFFLDVVAQKSSPLPPRWIGNTPHSLNSAFYFVEVRSDAASSLDAVRESVKKELATNIERKDKVSVIEILEDNSVQRYNGNKKGNKGHVSYQLNLKVEGEAVPIRSRRIDEYWKNVRRGNEKVLDYYALYAVEYKGSRADFSIITTTASYNARGLWRSAIVPGWGQFYKGANLKGGLILGTCAVLAAGIIFTESQRSDYARKIVQTHSANLKRDYLTKRDHWATGRNVCIGVGAALYIYNLIDAIVAPGARRVVVISKNRRYAVAPVVLNGGTSGLAASFTF